MLSLESSKALKAAGLVWEPKIYDFFESDNGIDNVCSLSFNDGKITHVNHWNWFPGKYKLTGLLFLPRLDQLLGEIEKRGYDYGLQQLEGEYVFMLYDRIPTGINPIYDYLADTPDEAAAQALLWILENKNE